MIQRTQIFIKILMVALLASLLYYCGEDSSTDIPKTYTNVTDELASGWVAYMEGDYASAETHFITVAERDAEVAEAYNGLAWTYLRQKEFNSAGSQFSFVVSLSDLQGNDTIKADAYAGMFLLQYIRKVEGVLNEELTEDQADELLLTGLQYADSVLKLNSDYNTEHDPGFDMTALKKLMAYTYYSMHRFSDAMGVLGEDVLSQVGIDTVTEEVHLESDGDGNVFGTLPSGGAIKILEVKDKSVIAGDADTSWTEYAAAGEELIYDYFLEGHDQMTFPSLEDYDYPTRTDTSFNVFLQSFQGPEGYYLKTKRAGIFQVVSMHLDTLEDELTPEIHPGTPGTPTDFEWNYARMVSDNNYVKTVGNTFVITYSYGNYEVTYVRTEEFLELLKLFEEYL